MLLPYENKYKSSLVYCYPWKGGSWIEPISKPQASHSVLFPRFVKRLLYFSYPFNCGNKDFTSNYKWLEAKLAFLKLRFGLPKQ